MHNEATYQIKTYNNVHTYVRRMENRHASVKWVATNYVHRIKSQLDWQISDMIDTVRRDYNVSINSSIAYRARAIARMMNDGSAKEQYKKLWSYAEEIRRANPGSIFVVSVDSIDLSLSPTFKRAYMCFNACKRGLLAGGRPVLCLDGCHLKCKRPGQLLTTVGIDGNGGIYHVAIRFS